MQGKLREVVEWACSDDEPEALRRVVGVVVRAKTSVGWAANASGSY